MHDVTCEIYKCAFVDIIAVVSLAEAHDGRRIRMHVVTESKRRRIVSSVL